MPCAALRKPQDGLQTTGLYAYACRTCWLADRPRTFEEMLGRVCGIVAGKELDVDCFLTDLLLSDVLSLMRAVHGIPEEERIGVFWAWDEALALRPETLQVTVLTEREICMYVEFLSQCKQWMP
jgi:hypothetical protein